MVFGLWGAIFAVFMFGMAGPHGAIEYAQSRNFTEPLFVFVIMDIWVERTLREIRAAYLQENLALRDSFPVYLTLLVEALSETVDRSQARERVATKNSTRIGKKHGGERAVSTHYTMDQLILEYHILRQVICDELEKEAILSPAEREIIVSSIE